MEWVNRIRLEVPFHDVDSLEVVWHGHYFKYFEQARTALMRKLDYDTPQMKDSGYAWPVVETNCRYRHALVLGQVFEVKAKIVGFESRLEIEYRLEDLEGRLLAQGFTAQAAVEQATNQLCLATPEVFRRQLGVL